MTAEGPLHVWPPGTAVPSARSDRVLNVHPNAPESDIRESSEQLMREYAHDPSHDEAQQARHAEARHTIRAATDDMLGIERDSEGYIRSEDMGQPAPEPLVGETARESRESGELEGEFRAIEDTPSEEGSEEPERSGADPSGSGRGGGSGVGASGGGGAGHRGAGPGHSRSATGHAGHGTGHGGGFFDGIFTFFGIAGHFFAMMAKGAAKMAGMSADGHDHSPKKAGGHAHAAGGGGGHH